MHPAWGEARPDGELQDQPRFSHQSPRQSRIGDRLIDELVGRAQAEGLQLTGEGGLLQQLTSRSARRRYWATCSE
ncbi:hypothetical protein ACIQTM_27990 [Streptomyces erythrochromogenes]|uniref:hypothetical protein n=1 Tax=Streptomyces erythrochromogenes TaxID=285574 RepID=UPI003806DAF3